MPFCKEQVKSDDVNSDHAIFKVPKFQPDIRNGFVKI